MVIFELTLSWQLHQFFISILIYRIVFKSTQIKVRYILLTNTMATAAKRFRYNVPTLDLVKPNIPTQGFNTKTVTEKGVVVDEFSIVPDFQLKAYFSQQSHMATWEDLKKVEVVLPRKIPSPPIMPFALTPLFIGCSWVLGIASDKLLVYHDRNPKDNYPQKTEGIKKQGATKIMRMDEKAISDLLKEKYKVTSDWVYGVAPSDPNKISSAFSYLLFEDNMWKINIQDIWTIPNPPSKYYKYEFQENCYQRVYNIV